MTGPTLTPTAIALIVALVLPLGVALVVALTRPRWRRFVGALVGGGAYALSHVLWDTLASYAGWWQFTTGRQAPLYFYLGSLAWGTCVALLGWRVQRRFGLSGVALYVLGLGVLGMINDYVGMATLNTNNIIAFAPGVAPLLADIVCSGGNTVAALLGMRLVAGPAKSDALASWRLRAVARA